jgi:hypothetical protein
MTEMTRNSKIFVKNILGYQEVKLTIPSKIQHLFGFSSPENTRNKDVRINDGFHGGSS